jgi:predicted Zn-dependent protease
MTVRIALLTFLLGLIVGGCLSEDKNLTAVPSGSPFGKAGRTSAASFKQAPAATQEIALRVDRVGKKIADANPRIQQKVVFLTLGVPHEEMFHQSHKDVGTIYITEGLAKQCKTDGELAAVLSEELGKMVSERMAQLRPANRSLPPMLMANTHVGNDNSGMFGSADRTEQMMAGHFTQTQQQMPTLPAAPPPADALARIYLKDAGFDAKNLDAVAPLLRKADKQNSIELSMTGKPTD